MNTRVGFSTTDHFLSKAIRLFTKSKVSHCFFVYFDEEWKRDMVMESTVGGFRIVPYNKFVLGKTIVGVYTPKKSIEEALAKAVDLLGEDYDYFGLFGMMWVMIGRWLKLKWRNPLASSKASFCSETMARVVAWAGYELPDKARPQDTDPELLYEMFKAEAA